MILKKRFIFLTIIWILFSLKYFNAEARPTKKIKHKTLKECIIADTLEIYPTDKILDYKGSYTQYFDLLHTRLDLMPSFKEKTIKGLATLKLTPHFYAQSELTLDAVGMVFDSILIDFDSFNTPTKYSYNGRSLTIELPKSVSRKDTFEVKIQYIAHPYDVASSMKKDGQGAYFINSHQTNPYREMMFWTQGEPEAASFWFPTLDATNQRCSQELFVTIPDTLVSISNGKLIQEIIHDNGTKTDYWKQDLTHSPYLFALVIGPFKKYQDKWKNLEVAYYTLSEFHQNEGHVFERTPEMIAYFSSLFSYDFPWDKYAQVAVYDFISGAMENTSISVFHEGLMQKNKNITESNRWGNDLIIAHELVHQWFGDLVTCESWAELTLNESFANYGEFLWLEKWKGREDAEAHWYNCYKRYLYECKNFGIEPIVQNYYEEPKDVFNRHRYEKGGIVLHLLRKYIGDEAFFEGLKYYLNQFAFQSAEVSQLRTSFEKVTGQDLNWFFNQWYYSPGHPIMETQHQYDTTHHEVVLTFNQNQNKYYNSEIPIHKLLIDVDFIYADTIIRHSVILNSKENQFRFFSERAPLAINYDPGKMQLWETNYSHSIEELKYIYQKSSKILDKIFVIDELANRKEFEKAAQILIPEFDQQHWFVQDKIVDLFSSFIEKDKPDAIHILKKRLLSDIVLDRASAIQQLKNIGSSDYFELAKSYLVSDSSEYMKYVCLSIIKDSLGVAAYPYTRNLLQAENINLKMVIAQIFASNPHSEDFVYFEKLIFTMNRYFSKNIYSSFQKYLLQLDNSIFQKGMELLTNVIQNEYPNERVKYAQELIKNLSNIAVGKEGMTSAKKLILKNYQSKISSDN